MLEVWIEHAPGRGEWYLGARGAGIQSGMTAIVLPGEWDDAESAAASDGVDDQLTKWGQQRAGTPWFTELRKLMIPVRPLG